MFDKLRFKLFGKIAGKSDIKDAYQELFKLIGTEANALGQPMNALILQILWGWVKNQNEAS